MSAYDLTALVLVACLVAGYPLHRRAVAAEEGAR